MWLISALLSIILLVGNATLGSIDRKLTAIAVTEVDHESRISKQEAITELMQGEILQLQTNREQDRLRLFPGIRVVAPAREKPGNSNDTQ